MKLSRRQLRGLIMETILNEELTTPNLMPDFVRQISSSITGRTLYIPDNVEKILDAKIKALGLDIDTIQLGDNMFDTMVGDPKVALVVFSDSEGNNLAKQLSNDKDLGPLFDFDYEKDVLMGKTAGEYFPDMLKDIIGGEYGRSSGLVFVKPKKGALGI